LNSRGRTKNNSRLLYEQIDRAVRIIEFDPARSIRPSIRGQEPRDLSTGLLLHT
jgi:hypothetical protein